MFIFDFIFINIIKKILKIGFFPKNVDQHCTHKIIIKRPKSKSIHKDQKMVKLSFD